MGAEILAKGLALAMGQLLAAGRPNASAHAHDEFAGADPKANAPLEIQSSDWSEALSPWPQSLGGRLCLPGAYRTKIRRQNQRNNLKFLLEKW